MCTVSETIIIIIKSQAGFTKMECETLEINGSCVKIFLICSITIGSKD